MVLKYFLIRGALVAMLTAVCAPATALAQTDVVAPATGGGTAVWRNGAAVRPAENQTVYEIPIGRKNQYEIPIGRKKIDRAKAYGRRMIRREEAAIERLNGMIERIERRIAKERAAGRDVSSLEPLVATAKEKRDAAIGAVREATAKYEALGTTETPRMIAQEANTATRKVKQALVELHAALRQIVSALKALR